MYCVFSIYTEETFKEIIKNRDWLNAGPISFRFAKNTAYIIENNKTRRIKNMLCELGVLLCLGTLLFGVIGLIVTIGYFVAYGCEIFREFTRRYFPAKYYYDWEDGIE